jgi:hypothetical protein
MSKIAAYLRVWMTVASDGSEDKEVSGNARGLFLRQIR